MLKVNWFGGCVHRKRSSLLSPARSEKVAKCYNANKTNPLACEDAIVEWVNDTKRIFEEVLVPSLSTSPVESDLTYGSHLDWCR